MVCFNVLVDQGSTFDIPLRHTLVVAVGGVVVGVGVVVVFVVVVVVGVGGVGVGGVGVGVVFVGGVGIVAILARDRRVRERSTPYLLVPHALR